MGHTRRERRGQARVLAAGALACSAIAFSAAVTGAARAQPQAGHRTLKQLVAEANKLSNEIDHLGQRYDGLRIQLAQARSEVRISRETVRRDGHLLALGRAAIAQLAAEGYMSGGLSPDIQLLESADPQQLLNSASIMLQLQRENGDKVRQVSQAASAAKRARLSAIQSEHRATKLAHAMAATVAKIQAKENVLNSAAFSKALAIYDSTGNYPTISVHGDSVGAQALRFALTRIGDPYVWGAAGPSAFDCSGLVVWAYAQIGIGLPHYTGYLWNSGEHIPRSELEPGDLVFFFADISHVGIYVGNGLMIDAPTFGQTVQIQPIAWSVYVGAVRIVA